MPTHNIAMNNFVRFLYLIVLFGIMRILLALYWTFSNNSSHGQFVFEKGLDFLYWIKSEWEKCGSFRKIETNLKRKIDI